MSLRLEEAAEILAIIACHDKRCNFIGDKRVVAETLFCDAFDEVELYMVVLTFRVCGENP